MICSPNDAGNYKNADSLIQHIFDYLWNQDVGYNCEKSCSIKEYIGETYLNSPYISDEKDQDVYKFKYRLNNLATTKVYEGYFIHDADEVHLGNT